MSCEEGEINKKATKVHTKIPEQEEDENDVAFALRVLGFPYLPSVEADVKRVQTQLRFFYHPDRNKNSIAAPMFKLIDCAAKCVITQIHEQTKNSLPARINTRTDYMSDNSDTGSQDGNDTKSSGEKLY